MFDVKPITDDGGIDILKISMVEPLLNLGRKMGIGKNGNPVLRKKTDRTLKEQPKSPAVISPEIKIIKKEVRVPEVPAVSAINHADDLERYLNEDIDAQVELTAIGGEILENVDAKPRYRPIPRIKSYEVKTINEEPENTDPESEIQNSESGEDYQNVLSQINQKISPAYDTSVFVGEPNRVDVVDWWKDKSKSAVADKEYLRPAVRKPRLKKIKFNVKLPKISFGPVSRKKIIMAGGVISVMIFSVSYGMSLKNEIVHEGTSAVASMETAGENIKKMDFTAASSNFLQAYQDFAKAGENLDFMGASLSSLVADLPGGGKLKSAKNLVETGKLMADAGQNMAQAMEELSRTGLVFDPSKKNVSIGSITKNLRQALLVSQDNLKEAGELLKDVSPDLIPEDKKTSFEEFNANIPLFEKLLSDAVDYSKFLEDFIGTAGTKKYLVLFQNPSELRPTGGFPGSYGIIVFKDGRLEDFRVDDIYNLDGQLKELYVPPLPLQHITPNWAMRDTNWFIDFPASAGKVMQFYKKESGQDVDGVITFSPKIVSEILKIVGPIKMEKYGLVLNSENFMQTIQEEIEYKADRAQPKKILVDLAPLMLEKIYSAKSEKWMEILNIFMSSVDRKDILMYFRNLKLQDFSVLKGFSGKVADVQSDYLMVTLTNVKGSKTDHVTDSDLKVESSFEGTNVRHRVTITRTHNGGGMKYGFYNKQNPAYVRMLVPKDSQLVSISGNSKPKNQPLLNYIKTDFKRDEDLVRLEETSHYDSETGVTIFEESGKREYGFWMIVNPGETKSVSMEYLVPQNSNGGDYELYIQKQPGLEYKSFRFNAGERNFFDGKLDKDIVIKIPKY